MIFLAYFLIGIGLLQAFASIGFPHVISKIGAVLVIIVGLFSIKDYFFEGKGYSFKMPAFSSELLKQWMFKATLPAALVLGFLVGLCTFPCSGGIYVAILSLLTAQTTYFEGLAYLVLYNLMFVSPLIIVLLLAANKKTLERLDAWEKQNKKLMKLATGIFMILLGIFLWLVAM
jgi:cytochrome c biogenesis protein CcdA